MEVLLDGGSVGKDNQSAQSVWGLTISTVDVLSGTTQNDGAADATSTGTIPPYDFQSGMDHIGTTIPIEWVLWTFHLTKRIYKLTRFAWGNCRLKPCFHSMLMPWKTSRKCGRYRTLTIEADNISATKGMGLKVSLMTPSATAIESEGITAYYWIWIERFVIRWEWRDVGFDFTSRPWLDGFQLRFHFYIPSVDDTEHHPIDWSKTQSCALGRFRMTWRPQAVLSCIGNTFNGDTSTPVQTKIEDIISLRAALTTPPSIGWLLKSSLTLVMEQTPYLNVPSLSNEHEFWYCSFVSCRWARIIATCTVKDDNGNESSVSNIIVVVPGPAAGTPLHYWEHIPSLVRWPANLAWWRRFIQPWPISILATYTFNAGDGSSAISGAQFIYSTYIRDHRRIYGDSPSGWYKWDYFKHFSSRSQGSSQHLWFHWLFTQSHEVSNDDDKRTWVKQPYWIQYIPRLLDMGQRTDEFVLQGSFLKETANLDIEFMEELHLTGALVEIVWEQSISLELQRVKHSSDVWRHLTINEREATLEKLHTQRHSWERRELGVWWLCSMGYRGDSLVDCGRTWYQNMVSHEEGVWWYSDWILVMSISLIKVGQFRLFMARILWGSTTNPSNGLWCSESWNYQAFNQWLRTWDSCHWVGPTTVVNQAWRRLDYASCWITRDLVENHWTNLNPTILQRCLICTSTWSSPTFTYLWLIVGSLVMRCCRAIVRDCRISHTHRLMVGLSHINGRTSWGMCILHFSCPSLGRRSLLSLLRFTTPNLEQRFMLNALKNWIGSSKMQEWFIMAWTRKCSRCEPRPKENYRKQLGISHETLLVSVGRNGNRKQIPRLLEGSQVSRWERA